MNSYITLDGKKYRTPAQAWVPIMEKPATERYVLSGAADVTYGPMAPMRWKGEIEGPVTPDDGAWGSITDLRTTVQKTVAVSFTDHYGTGYTVHILGPLFERSLSPMWDSASNKIYIMVELVKV
jgi:hypothetical protein